MKKNRILIISLTMIITSLFIGCYITPIIGQVIQHDKLSDGIYRGSFKGGLNSAVVMVTILDQKVVDIQIIEHDTLKGKKAELIIPKVIIEKQSTFVDTVTGATNSSLVIMNAVQKAVEKSYKE